MRHRHAQSSLSRKKDHRKALIRNLITSLFDHGRIKTTDAKAKAIIPYVERLISIAKKKDAMNAIRIARKYFFTDSSSRKLFTYAEKTKDKVIHSGHCRATRLHVRSDSATIVMLELI